MLDTNAIEGVVGHRGTMVDNVLRSTHPPDGNLEINGAMGYNTWAAFQGTNERAAVCGDFAMFEREVTSVIHELRTGGQEVAAIHNHMFFEDPRMIFLHYWGVARAVELPNTCRRALDRQKNG